MQFRTEVKNPKGLRPIPVVLNTGKSIDWNMLNRKEKLMMKKAIKKQCPKLWAKIELSKKLKIYCEPIAENVYFCDQCNKTHVAHELDKGMVPALIPCHNCAWPQARSLGYEIPESYKGAAPQIIFRLPLEEEYNEAAPELKKYLEDGGLFMEKVK